MFRTSEKMVRTYTKKCSTPDVPEDVTRKAIKAITERNMSFHEAASLYGMTHTALYQRIKKSKEVEDVLDAGIMYSSKYSSQQVFNQPGINAGRLHNQMLQSKLWFDMPTDP
jgi:predicted DNA-binding protein YlxM (UPF0122 family)